MPDAFGLATICIAGLLKFSNGVQVQAAPFPPTSKLIGAFCADTVKPEKIASASVNFFCRFLFILFCFKLFLFYCFLFLKLFKKNTDF